jgi:thioredoxin reductase (NADPH)
MAGKPVLLTVDDDAAVARAVQRDLRRRYAERFRVLSAGSGAQGLELLDQLKLRDDQVALLLVDQRMPRMSGVEFLEQAKERFPIAKRALLTAYADTEAAIKAINDVDLDRYLMKPWDPPEEHLYPVVDDLIYDWETSGGPREEGVRVVGHRFSRASHELRDFLARNLVPYRWLDVDSDEAHALFEAAGVDAEPALPTAVFTDGSVLRAPTIRQVAEQLGLPTQASADFYDLVIVGGGPAGLAAAVYGASEGLRTVLVEREAPGGQAGQSSRIENYLGFPSGLAGSDLARRGIDQARRFGAEVLAVQTVERLERHGRTHVVRLSDGGELRAHAVLVATGVDYRKLDAPGAEALTGAGVYYGAAMTEALSCRGQDVFLVGGANSAGQAAMYFADYARQVTLLVRGESLAASMSRYLIDRIEATENVVVRTRSRVVAAHGDGHLEALDVEGPDGRERLPAGTLFVFIGASPQTDWLDGAVERDERGFVLTGPELLRDGRKPRGWPLERDPFLLETSAPGVFAAGDVRHDSIKRVASAVGEGSMAVQFVHRHLASQ